MNLGTIDEIIIISGKLILASNYSLSYSSLPSYGTNQIGYVNSITKNSNTTFVSWDSILNLSSLSFTVGVYILQYNFSIALTSSTLGWTDKGWNCTALSTSISDLNTCPNKTYFYTSNISYHSISNSYYYVFSTSKSIYLNSQMISNDNTGLAGKFFISNPLE